VLKLTLKTTRSINDVVNTEALVCSQTTQLDRQARQTLRSPYLDSTGLSLSGFGSN